MERPESWHCVIPKGLPLWVGMGGGLDSWVPKGPPVSFIPGQ